MPKRTDISKILVLGSGPIIIGQSAEFDYSGTQACKALKSEGFEVVLANSNPATIMTDPEFADRTYIEPLTREFLEEIIRIEREMSPGAGFAVLPTVGGQTALNLAIELSDGGVLEKYNVSLIGAQISAIKKAEDRLFFKDAMQKIGLDVPKSALVNNTKDGLEFAGKIGFPVIVRPSFTLGGRFAFCWKEGTGFTDVTTSSASSSDIRRGGSSTCSSSICVSPHMANATRMRKSWRWPR